MTTAFHLTPLQLAQLALRVHPEALRVYAEAYTLMNTKTYRIGHDDITDLPIVFWLDICAEDANGHSRVVIPVTESRAMLPRMARICADANYYIDIGAAYRPPAELACFPGGAAPDPRYTWEGWKGRMIAEGEARNRQD